jgi:hypothetical protein
MIDKDVILAAANIMSDKGYGLGNEPDYLKFKAGRMLLTLVKYRDAGVSSYTYFWKNQEERCVSPFYDSEADAMKFIKEADEWDNWRPNKDIV